MKKMFFKYDGMAGEYRAVVGSNGTYESHPIREWFAFMVLWIVSCILFLGFMIGFAFLAAAFIL